MIIELTFGNVLHNSLKLLEHTTSYIYLCKYAKSEIIQSQRAIEVTSIEVEWLLENDYGVATISRLLKIIGLFCKRDL